MNARNAQIIEARASGRPLQSIAVEHGLSVQHVHRIIREHERRMEIAEKNRRIRELEAELIQTRYALEMSIMRERGRMRTLSEIGR